MQYALLIYSKEDRWASLSDEERSAVYAEYEALSRDLRQRDALVGGSELQATSTATAVRVREGDTQVTDGPFAETREVLGGFYMIEADSLDEAIEWAARVPAAKHGTIEVRPVVMREAEVSA
jgi:hypothetical protein